MPEHEHDFSVIVPGRGTCPICPECDQCECQALYGIGDEIEVNVQFKRPDNLPS